MSKEIQIEFQDTPSVEITTEKAGMRAPRPRIYLTAESETFWNAWIPHKI